MLVLPEQDVFSSAGEVILVLQQSLPDSLVAVQHHDGAGAQVHGEHRPEALGQLRDRQAGSEVTADWGTGGSCFKLTPRVIAIDQENPEGPGDCLSPASLGETLQGLRFQCTCAPGHTHLAVANLPSVGLLLVSLP